MPKQLKKCTKCSRYSLHEQCPFCANKTKTAHPMNFSIDDKYSEYRRKAKEMEK